jgi:chromosome segregation ATPase
MIFLNNSKRSKKHLGYGNRAKLQRGQLGSRISDKSKNSLFQKISSIFLATVLLGSIATFPPYAEDNSLDASKQDNLQNPEIKKIIELFSGFMPTLQEAEAAPNENAIKAKNFRLLGLSGQLSSATLEMNLSKGELAVLAHNPSSNSKKVQELQAKLASSMDNVITVAEEMGNELDKLKDEINKQTKIDKGKVDFLKGDLVDLETQTTDDEQEKSVLSGNIDNFVSMVNNKKNEMKEHSKLVLDFAEGGFVDTVNATPPNSILGDPNYSIMFDNIENQINVAEELEDLEDEQNQLRDQSISLGSQIKQTKIKSKQISSGASQATGSLSGLDDSITIAHNAVLQQEMALNSLELAISTSPKGVPFKIQDLQNQINILRAQIVDLQGQINELVIVVNDIQSQVNDLKTGVADLETRSTILESEVDTLQQQMNDLLNKNIFGTLSIAFGLMATALGFGASTTSCVFLDFGACSGFIIGSLAFGIASGVMALLA